MVFNDGKKDYIFCQKREVSKSSEGAAREWSTVVVVTVIFMT